MPDEDQQKLIMLVAEIATKMQVLLDKQDELGENISKIKEAVYNPDTGLYARLTKLDARLDALEDWKRNNAKVLWIIITVSVGLLLNAGWHTIF
tara:strand:+ start:6880 stop:7161 length:282 start_codon:yes stop_codon:yes gene_type:complete